MFAIPRRIVTEPRVKETGSDPKIGGKGVSDGPRAPSRFGRRQPVLSFQKLPSPSPTPEASAVKSSRFESVPHTLRVFISATPDAQGEECLKSDAQRKQRVSDAVPYFSFHRLLSRRKRTYASPSQRNRSHNSSPSQTGR